MFIFIIIITSIFICPVSWKKSTLRTPSRRLSITPPCERQLRSFLILSATAVICRTRSDFAPTSCTVASPCGTPLVWSQEHFDCSIAALAAARWPLLLCNDKSKRQRDAAVIPYASAGPGAAFSLYFFFFCLCLTRLQPQGPARQQLL